MLEGNFSEQILQFTRSIDRCDNDLISKIRNLIVKYLNNNKEIIYFEVMQETRLEGDNNQRLLETVWKVIDNQLDESKKTTLILDKGDKYQSHQALSIIKKTPLWIINKDKKNLIDSDGEFIDKWANSSDVNDAVYQEPDELKNRTDKTKTYIVVPFQYNGEYVGVFDLELSSCSEPGNEAKKELETLASALGNLYGLRQSAEHPERLTNLAISQIENSVSFISGISLSKPKLFFSYSNEAANEESPNSDVIQLVRDILDTYSNKLDIIDWAKINKPGNINDQTFESIQQSNFGICYLSEVDATIKGNEVAYKYNPNVVFEAGMFQVIAPPSSNGKRGWIPIRENNSPGTPVNFITQRGIIVPRSKDGTLDKEAFSEELKDLIDDHLG